MPVKSFCGFWLCEHVEAVTSLSVDIEGVIEVLSARIAYGGSFGRDRFRLFGGK